MTRPSTPSSRSTRQLRKPRPRVSSSSVRWVETGVPWCLRFADFIENDTTVSKVIEDNFVYAHVNYNPRKSEGEVQAQQAAALMKRLNNCGRFGFPVFVVLDGEGTVIHIQDSSFLEEGQGYNQEKVLRFFKNWAPKAVKP